MNQADVERFLSKVSTEPDENGCLMYLGGWSSDGYGKFWLDGKQVQAHRVAWLVHNGPILNELHVLHKCDNRWCVAIEHLFLGTPQVNVADMRAKGRDTYGENRGERNGQAILTEDEVREIHELVSNGYLTSEEIGDQFGVSARYVRAIKNRQTWKHLWLAPSIQPEGENTMSELDDLKRQVAELKQKLDPPPRQPSTHRRFDPTEGMSMPRSAMMEMAKAIPESVMRGIVGDAFKPNPVTGGVTKPTATEPPKSIGKKGWLDERPIEPPPGIAIMDRMMDAQDAQDRTELARKIAQARMSKGE